MLRFPTWMSKVSHLFQHQELKNDSVENISLRPCVKATKANHCDCANTIFHVPFHIWLSLNLKPFQEPIAIFIPDNLPHQVLNDLHLWLNSFVTGSNKWLVFWNLPKDLRQQWDFFIIALFNLLLNNALFIIQRSIPNKQFSKFI